MKKNTHITLILTLTFLITASGCSTYAAVPTAASTTAENTSATEMTKEPTETAAATTSETAAETTGETAATTTAALPVVTVLAAPTTYAASFDTVRIYTDASRITVQAVLAKGDQVIITGTADKYGVTGEGYYVNLNLMTLVVIATPTPAETTAATTKETVKPSKETSAPVATTAAPASGTYENAMAKAVLELVNQQRSAAGLPALAWSDSLAATAKIRAQEISVSFSHTRPCKDAGGGAMDCFTAFPSEFCSVAENIAKGQTCSADVMAGWMGSENHKNNILRSTVSQLGVACFNLNGTYYWVQDFGG